MRLCLFALCFCLPASALKVTFVGDVMLDELPGEVVKQGRDPFEFVAKSLGPEKVRVANLECSVATKGAPVSKAFTFRAHPRTLAPLAKYFDGVSLANNHSGDYGVLAFGEMLGLLNANQLPYFGGGTDLMRAHAPWVVNRDGVGVAFLGYNEFKPRSFEATATQSGIAWSDDEQVLFDIAEARKIPGVDIVIPFMHWGWEEDPAPSERQRTLARLMIDAGADMVVGSHPHVTQGFETYRGKLVVYSLGNFLFNGFSTDATTTGWILNTEWDRSGLKDWDIQAVRLDPEGLPHLDLKPVR